MPSPLAAANRCRRHNPYCCCAPMGDRVDALLQRMSLAEKIGQLNHPNIAADTTGAGGAVTDIEARIQRGEVGLLSTGLDPQRADRLQQIAVEQSPHGIPLLFTL